MDHSKRSSRRLDSLTEVNENAVDDVSQSDRSHGSERGPKEKWSNVKNSEVRKA